MSPRDDRLGTEPGRRYGVAITLPTPGAHCLRDTAYSRLRHGMHFRQPIPATAENAITRASASQRKQAKTVVSFTHP
jgi:hypothetical protein